jgi:hypothetical protein
MWFSASVMCLACPSSSTRNHTKHGDSMGNNCCKPHNTYCGIRYNWATREERVVPASGELSGAYPAANGMVSQYLVRYCTAVAEVRIYTRTTGRSTMMKSIILLAYYETYYVLCTYCRRTLTCCRQSERTVTAWTLEGNPEADVPPLHGICIFLCPDSCN